jgi:4-amino-4-deoxy-L-arabinose transferase-like glycosyltransferase
MVTGASGGRGDPGSAQRRSGWKDAGAVAAIFALAGLVRLAVLQEIRPIPSFDHLLIDAAAYDAWARRIAAGDWWGNQVFYQAPAYPYFIAAVYRLLGAEVAALHAAQMLVGALSCAGIFVATRLLFGRVAGVAAGVLLAVYPPAVFFDAIIQKTSLGLLLTSGLLVALVAFQRRPRALWLLLAGILLGLLALTRENALIWIPCVLAWLVLRFRSETLTRRLLWTACLGLGLAATLGPVALRNQALGGTFAVTTSQLGTNFFYGNNPDANGIYRPLVPGRHTPRFESPDATRLAEQALGRPLTPGEVSDYWLGRGLRFVAEEPWAWARLMLWKLALTWNRYEIPDTEDLSVYADYSRWLSATAPWLHFGVLVPLGLAGLVFAWREPRARRDAALLVLLGGVYALGVALFLVAARFRFPLVPLLLPFVGLALARTGAVLRERRFEALALPGVALLFGAGLSNLTLLDPAPFRASAYANLGGALLHDRDLEGAERLLTRAEAIYAGDAFVQFDLGVLRLQQGRLDESERHLRRAIALEPNDFRGHRVLARVLERQGRPEEARSHRRRARRLDPDRDPAGPAKPGSRTLGGAPDAGDPPPAPER